MSSSNPWTWSAEHRRYYRYEFRNGVQVLLWDESQGSQQQSQQAVPVYQFQSAPYANTEHNALGYQTRRIDHAYTQAGATASSSDQTAGATSYANHHRADSIVDADLGMTPSAPDDIRGDIVFKGTPERGWYEPLDSRYRVRTRKEEYEFFTRGRVFAMLWSEAAGQTPSNRTDNTNFTAHPNSSIVIGRFGEKLYCSIRRFVIVRVNRANHFVEACAITSYGNRGVLKPGCDPVEHTIVYMQGTRPQYVEGEVARGMTKNPIAIVPADPTEPISVTSRLRLGKTFTIECNVKVRDIGKVVPEQLTTLLRYHRDSRNLGFEPDDWDDDQTVGTLTSPQAGLSSYQSNSNHAGSRSHQSTQGQQSHSGYRQPSNYQNPQTYQNPQDQQNTQVYHSVNGSQHPQDYQATQTYQDPQGYQTAPDYYGAQGSQAYQ